MATKTQYYNLDKPSYDEVADIEVINANMDKIDQHMRNNADGVNFAKGISSDAYDNSKSYAVGDYCIYDNKLYRCITAIESAEEFNIAKWKQTTVGKEVKQLNSNLVEQKMLGWNVPEECPVQNIVSNEVFTQKVGRVDLGKLDWSYSSEYKRFSTSGITDYKKKDSSTNTWVADAFLKGYSTTSGNNTASDSYNKSIGFNGTSNMFFVKNTSYTDATTFKNAMQGVYLYYELETPITMDIDGNEAVTQIKNDLGGLSLSASGKTLTITYGTNTWTLEAN